MCSEGYSCRSVCLCVYDSSRTTGYEAAYELYQQLQCYKDKKNNVAILLKPLLLTLFSLFFHAPMYHVSRMISRIDQIGGRHGVKENGN